MKPAFRKWSRTYAAAMRKYLREEGEDSLQKAYELGRTAMARGLGVWDMTRIHEEAFQSLLSTVSSRAKRTAAWNAAKIFLLESLSPFEAAHRGFREMNLRLQQTVAALEERNAKLGSLNRMLNEQIQQRRRAEWDLLESERRFATLIETADDVIFLVGTDGRFELLNSAFERMTNWRRADWMGKPFARLLHPDEADIALDRFSEVLGGRPSQPREYRILKPDGCYLDAEFTFSCEFKGGTPVGIFGIARDITERKRAIEALRISEERFRLLVLNVSDYAIYLIEPDGRVASWNVGAERLKGYREAEILGQSYARFFRPEDIRRGLPKRQLAQARREGRYEGEGWRVRKDGSQFWGSVVISPVYDGAGRLRWFAKVVRDMTERKRLEESLRKLSHRILAAQEEERQRISRELHDDFGQSLTAISVALAALAKHDTANSDRNSQAFDQIQSLLEETMRTAHRFARELRPALLDELGLLPALRSHVKGFAERMGLRVDFAADPLAEGLDRERKTALFRIAQESLTNVAKHACATRVSVSLSQIRGGVRMEIADNGKSFHDDPKAVSERKERLGLVGMRERVRLLDGEFRISAKPGKGTTVRVKIPFAPGKPDVENPL